MSRGAGAVALLGDLCARGGDRLRISRLVTAGREARPGGEEKRNDSDEDGQPHMRLLPATARARERRRNGTILAAGAARNTRMMGRLPSALGGNFVRNRMSTRRQAGELGRG